MAQTKSKPSWARSGWDKFRAAPLTHKGLAILAVSAVMCWFGLDAETAQGVVDGILNALSVGGTP